MNYIKYSNTNEFCSNKISLVGCFVGPEKGSKLQFHQETYIYLELVYLVTAFVPSDTACLANSPGRRSRTAVCISLDVIVDLLLQWARRLASVAIRSKRSFTNEFIMLIALDDTPVSGCTCFRTL